MTATTAPPGQREAVELRHAAGTPVVIVTELRGTEELAVTDTSTWAAVELVELLLARSAPPGSVWQPGTTPAASDLTAADRDRLLAAAYRTTFGDRIESNPVCSSCGERYELEFSLGSLLDTIGGGDPVPTERAIPVPGGGVVRLPTGRDELTVSAVDPERRAQALLGRCLTVADEPSLDTGEAGEQAMREVEAILADLAPTVDRLLTPTCPECGAEQEVRFDLQAYVLGMLVAGRNSVLGELHRLAAAYGWSAEAILSLPRSDRSRLARLAEADASGRRSGR